MRRFRMHSHDVFPLFIMFRGPQKWGGGGPGPPPPPPGSAPGVTRSLAHMTNFPLLVEKGIQAKYHNL